MIREDTQFNIGDKIKIINLTEIDRRFGVKENEEAIIETKDKEGYIVRNEEGILSFMYKDQIIKI